MTASTLSSPQLLVVEDNLALQHLLRDALEEMGYPATGASSLDQALRLVQYQPIDVIVTGTFARTPQDALASLRPLRQLPHPIPVVVCTGWPVTDTAVKEHGFAALVPNPFLLDHLVVTVAECLNQPFSDAHRRQAELVRRFLAATKRWDIDALMALVADEITFSPWFAPLIPSAHVQAGRDAARAYLHELARYFGPLRLDQLHLYPCPGGVAARFLLQWHTPDAAARERMMRLCFQFTDEGQIRQIGIPLGDEYLQARSIPHEEDNQATW
jgi:CheY-like chemotaxis protein